MTNTKYNSYITTPMPGKQKGVALMMVLFVFALVTILASGMISRQSLFIKKASNTLIQSQAYGYAIASEIIARQILFIDWEKDQKATKFIDTLDEDWGLMALGSLVEYGVVEAQIDDLQGALNVNSLIDSNGAKDQASIERFENLFLVLSIPEVKIETFLDWIDENDNSEGIDGAEDAEYLIKEKPYRTGNQAFVSTSELILLDKMPPEYYKKLLPHISALPVGVKAININTCSKEILRSLAQGRILSEAEGDAIIKQRPFETVADFKAIDEYRGLTLNGEFSVNSEFFKVSAKVSLADRVSRLVSILYRDSSNGELTLMERNQGKKYLITKEIFLQQ